MTIETSFGKSIWVSVIFHSLFVSYFLIKSVFLPTENLEYQSAIRVDIVDLPDKIDPSTLVQPEPQSTPEKIEPEPTPEKETAKAKTEEVIKKSPEPPKEDTINLNKAKNKQQDALNKLKRLSAIDKIKQDMAKTKSAGQKAPKFKGNVLSPGTALKGLDRLQHESYQSSIDTHVKQNWALPEWLSKKDLRAQVRVKLDEKGNVIASQLVRSSGHPTYDEIVLEAIKKSSPFPAPPEKFIDIVALQGILLGFPE